MRLSPASHHYHLATCTATTKPNGSRTGSRGAPAGRSLLVLTSAQAAEDGDSGHSQPTRLKYQRSTTTVTAMMAIASG